MNKILPVAILVLGFTSSAMAVSTAAPEIDPSSAVSALTVLAGAVAILRGRRSKI